MTSINFNTDSVEPSQDFDLLPAGQYMAVVSKSEVKTNSKGDGQYIKAELSIIDGPFKNRKVWHNLSFTLSDPAKEMNARRNLKKFTDALGVRGVVESTEQLHDLPLLIDVIVEPEQNGYAAKNGIKLGGYKSVGGMSSAPSVPGAVVNQQAAASNSTPAWKRKAA